MDWEKEINYFVYDYFKYVLGDDFYSLWPLLNDLNRFDYYTSHLNFIGEEVFAAFQYDPVALIAAPGVLQSPDPCWYRFRTDQQMNSNFFNGQFLRKSFDKTDSATAAAFNRGRFGGGIGGIDGIDDLDDLIASAHSALEQGDGVGAESMLRRALPAAPESAELLHLLGLTVAGGGLLDEALLLLRRAIMADRGKPLYRVTLGAVCVEADRWKEAEREYRIALAQDPTLLEGHFNLADLLSETNRLPEAVSAYQSALRLQPDLVEAHYNLGGVLTELGRHDEAAAAHQKAAALAPELFPDFIKTDGLTQH
ncbi:MAG: tetratricopeptide repeat protein [Proteobacteria bacterium]|nr:tetratricopeptide repeat protein [Pseudomonadota bacterium]